MLEEVKVLRVIWFTRVVFENSLGWLFYYGKFGGCKSFVDLGLGRLFFGVVILYLECLFGFKGG